MDRVGDVVLSSPSFDRKDRGSGERNTSAPPRLRVNVTSARATGAADLDWSRRPVMGCVAARKRRRCRAGRMKVTR
jgi:hypothetical protein